MIYSSAFVLNITKILCSRRFQGFFFPYYSVNIISEFCLLTVQVINPNISTRLVEEAAAASEQQEAENSAAEQEEPYLMQRHLHLNLPPPQPRAAPARLQGERAGVVHTHGLLVVPEHPREHRNRQSPEHPSGSGVHSPCRSQRRRRGLRRRRVVAQRVVVVVVMVFVVVELVMLTPAPVGWHRVDFGVEIFVGQSRGVGLRCYLVLVADGRWPARDVDVLMGALGDVSSSVERDQSILGEGCLADRAVLRGCGLDLQPLVDAWPAVQVAAEGNHWIHGEVQADVAVEAPAGSSRWRGNDTGDAVATLLQRFLIHLCRLLTSFIEVALDNPIHLHLW